MVFARIMRGFTERVVSGTSSHHCLILCLFEKLNRQLLEFLGFRVDRTFLDELVAMNNFNKTKWVK